MTKHTGPVVCAAAVVLAALAHPAGVRAQASPELRVFISADMEGITGVVNGAQLAPGEFEYERFRKLMTGEVNAAVEGALAAGATKVTVADSHGNGLNLLVEELNPKARLIRSWPRPLEMMEGVEGGFDAAMFIGYHASINTPQAVRAHSISSRRFYDLRLNGRHASEGMLNAAIAGHFGVPIVFVSGDDATLAELRGTLGAGLAGVAVKRAIGYHAADSLAPDVARERIRAESETALRQRATAKPFVIAGPVRLEISFKNMINAEVMALLPVVERVDGATVAFTGKDIVEAVKFVAFATQYDSTQ